MGPRSLSFRVVFAAWLAEAGALSRLTSPTSRSRGGSGAGPQLLRPHRWRSRSEAGERRGRAPGKRRPRLPPAALPAAARVDLSAVPAPLRLAPRGRSGAAALLPPSLPSFPPSTCSLLLSGDGRGEAQPLATTTTTAPPLSGRFPLLLLLLGRGGRAAGLPLWGAGRGGERAAGGGGRAAFGARGGEPPAGVPPPSCRKLEPAPRCWAPASA